MNLRDLIKTHYRQTGPYTYAGPYADYFRSLPDDLAELSRLVCAQIIHRATLREGNTNANQDLRYGDMTQFPWSRQRCEDDVFLTASAMTAELFRLDEAGFTLARKVENKIVVTCRYVSVLMSAIFKAKGIPCRSRNGFAPYFFEGQIVDHWINQVWSDALNRWITFDADGFYDRGKIGFEQYDMPVDRFDWAAETWLAGRRGDTSRTQYIYADGLGINPLKAIIRSVFYDFHALMNHEISYKFQPCYVDGKYDQLTEDDFREIDELAELMCDPDKNFDNLLVLWNTQRKFRILNSPLVYDQDNNSR